MLGLSIQVPIACWRKAHAREFLETEILPPPSTCYGFLLALVGEADRERHIGARVSAGRIAPGEISIVLRTLWRIKSKGKPPGTGDNLRPDYQQLVCGATLSIWVDRGEEVEDRPSLEQRVTAALREPASIRRFGGLSLGESTHLVDAIEVLVDPPEAETFVLTAGGRLSLPVWVDHVAAAGTRSCTGDLQPRRWPTAKELPIIMPPDG